MRTNNKGRGVAFAAAAAVAITLFVTGSASFGSNKPTDPTKEDNPVSVKEITTPDSKSSHLVFRNGKYHNVTVKERVFLEKMPDGHERVKITVDTQDAKAQAAKLPVQDPAFDNVVPTEGQFRAAAREAGLELTPEGTPAPPPPPPGYKDDKNPPEPKP